MRIKIPIGDWSGDGHEKNKDFIIESNLPVEVLQQAYKDSCKLTGISFNHNEDYTGLKLDWKHPEYKDRQIATDYEDSTISKLAEDILISHGLDFRADYEFYRENPEESLFIDGPKHFLEILLSFIKLSAPSFEWSLSKKEDLPVLNGYWNKELNVQFGYGLFH